MALLLGGFTLNANAQITMNGKNSNTSKKAVIKNAQVKGENLDKMLVDYEKAVSDCLTIYYALQKKDGPVKYTPEDFNKALNQAETLKNKLEKSKANLNRTQMDRYNKATKKLLQVYQK